MNVFVIEDDNWDNYAIISKYISTNYLPENVRIQHVYNKHLQHVSNICSDNNFDIYRRHLDFIHPKKSYYEIIKNMNMCIIFHNFIEYTTSSSFIIKVCEENKIPYIIITEHSKKCYLNGEVYDGKFKGALKMAINMGGDISSCGDFKIIDDELDIYKNLNNQVIKEKKSIHEMKEKLRNNYDRIKEYRNNNSIIYMNN